MKSALLQLLLWIVVCVAVLVGQGFWYATIANKSASVAGLQQQIDSKVEAASRAASARSALAEIAGDESIVQSYFVPETGVVPFIDALQALADAQTATLKVLSVSVGAASAPPSLVLSLTIQGTFDAVMRTVGAIEYAPYALSVSKLSLGKDTKNVWHADMGIVVGSVSAIPAAATP